VDERTTSHHLRWIYWLLQALELDTGSDEAAVPGLNRDKAYEREVLLPDYGTQEATASFLDFEAQAVDTLIEAKQKLLGLLAEKRRTLVAEAVMRGLDRSSPLRPSGIDWLGDVPAHWDSVPLRFLVSFMGGATPDTKKEEYWNGEIPWVSPKDMKRDFIADSEDHISDLALANSALKMIDEEAVLIVVRGMILAHSFPTAINTVPVTINQDMKALRCDERISPRFLKVVLEGATQYLVDQADSSAHGTKKLETGVLGGLGIPVPPLEEQEQIIARIAEERVKIDKLATATERSIGLLKERRSALIAAAVTGQIAIPEAA
jgi:type I restriction enzyme S subunit